MKTKTKILLGSLVIGGVAIGAIVTGDSSDLQGRFNFAGSNTPTVNTQMNTSSVIFDSYVSKIEAMEDEAYQVYDQAYNAYLIGTMSGLEAQYVEEHADIVTDMWVKMSDLQVEAIELFNEIDTKRPAIIAGGPKTENYKTWESTSSKANQLKVQVTEYLDEIPGFFEAVLANHPDA